MKIEPIIPVAVMAVWCVGLLAIRWNKKKMKTFLRQILIVILLFMLNLRIMIPSDHVEQNTMDRELYVLFVMDDTISMIAEDSLEHKTRMEDAKEDCKRIVSELSGARYSLITFHNESQIRMPYTENEEFTESMINSVAPLSTTWAKGTTLNVCIDDLETMVIEAKSKENGAVAVFFLSDGEIINGDSLKSFHKAAPYIDMGAVIGYGTENGGKMYMDGEQGRYIQKSDYPYGDALSYIDEKNLKKIADDLELPYIHRTTADSLDTLISDIDKESVYALAEKKSFGYVETYYFFAIPLVGMLAWELWSCKKKTYF